MVADEGFTEVADSLASSRAGEWYHRHQWHQHCHHHHCLHHHELGQAGRQYTHSSPAAYLPTSTTRSSVANLLMARHGQHRREKERERGHRNTQSESVVVSEGGPLRTT